MKFNNDVMDYLLNAYLEAPIMQRKDQLWDKQIKLEDELSKSLTDWQKKLFQEYQDVSEDMYFRDKNEHFKAGYQCGIKAILDGINHRTTMFLD